MVNMKQNVLIACDQLFGGLDIKRDVKPQSVHNFSERWVRI